MVVGSSQQETFDLGFVLLGTCQQSVPVILSRLMILDNQIQTIKDHSPLDHTLLSDPSKIYILKFPPELNRTIYPIQLMNLNKFYHHFNEIELQRIQQFATDEAHYKYYEMCMNYRNNIIKQYKNDKETSCNQTMIEHSDNTEPILNRIENVKKSKRIKSSRSSKSSSKSRSNSNQRRN
ncbi:unnamed protein product [Schistosoma margrebowiei]|uniref:Uncharacterized protein n=1 Tax=Schistosoma margrebowiei TaxID=48269 RepID=A0A183L8Y2_9TREM|nr:unnamed protein product [Schistosoma margrebowiei]